MSQGVEAYAGSMPMRPSSASSATQSEALLPQQLHQISPFETSNAKIIKDPVSEEFGDEPNCCYLLTIIAEHYNEIHDEYKDKKVSRDTLNKNPKLREALKSAWKVKAFEAILGPEFGYLRLPPQRAEQERMDVDNQENDASTRLKRPRSVSSSTQGEAPPSQRLKMDPVTSARYKELNAKILDDPLVKTFSGDSPEMWTLLMVIASNYVEIKNECRNAHASFDIIQKNEGLKDALKKAWKTKSFESILDFEYLRIPPPPVQSPSALAQMNATKHSWEHDYVGDVEKHIWEYVVAKFQSPPKTTYARYTAIVQSSGMGKSRAVDELSKTHFVIPLCLRDDSTTGFPPPDPSARNYLTSGTTNSEDVSIRATSFLAALFEATAKAIDDIHEKEPSLDSLESLASEFRARMTDGQTIGQCNKYRSIFYKNVVDEAKELEKVIVARGPGVGSPTGAINDKNHKPTKGFSALKAAILKVIESERAAMRKDEPLVVLVFDEAHALTKPHDGQPPIFAHLRSELRKLFDKPLFSLFLSTTVKLTQFVPLPKNGPSNRIVVGHLDLIEPFTDLGFDLLATRGCDDTLSLAKVSSDAYMAQFGRPLFAARCKADPSMLNDIVLFAASKLVNMVEIRQANLSVQQMLACLSQRIPIDFISTTFLPSEFRVKLLDSEAEQVESHMRICLKAERSIETMKTVVASEPLLSEASFLLMQMDTFSAPDALKKVLSGFAIAKGDRGEFLVLLQAILARDAAVRNANPNLETFWSSSVTHDVSMPLSRVINLYDFLHQLLKVERDGHLDAVFKNFTEAKLHFNHFVKVYEEEVLNPQCLAALLTRGAAVLCADGQESMDIVIPILLGTSDVVNSKKLALIAVQVKNDCKYGTSPKWPLCNSMANWLKKNKGPPAVIRIVFALASKRSEINVKLQNETTEVDGIQYQHCNIWCAGFTPTVLSQVKEKDQGTWDALLQGYRRWDRVFMDGEGNETSGVRHRAIMNPGAAYMTCFWDMWWEFKDLALPKLPTPNL